MRQLRLCRRHSSPSPLPPRSSTRRRQPNPAVHPPPALPSPSQSTSATPQTLKVQVNLVNVYFSVRDKSGFLTNLHKDDCSIFEDKAPPEDQKLHSGKKSPPYHRHSPRHSGSQRNVLPLEQQSGAEFLKDVLTPKDEAFLISFDINVNLLADYTNSPPRD